MTAETTAATKTKRNRKPAADIANAPAASFAPGIDWYTIKQAAAFVWGEDAANDQKRHQTIRNAVKLRAEFQNTDAANPDRVRFVPIEGYDIAPLCYISRGALEAYKRAVESGDTGSRVGRVSPDGKRWIVKVPDEKREAVEAALAPFGIKLLVASTPKPKKSATPAASANGTSDASQTSDGAPNAPASADDVPAADSADSAATEVETASE